MKLYELIETLELLSETVGAEAEVEAWIPGYGATAYIPVVNAWVGEVATGDRVFIEVQP